MRQALRALTLGLAVLLPGAVARCGDRGCTVAGPAWPDRVGPWLPMIDGHPSHAKLRLGKDGGLALDLSGTGFGGGWRPVGRDELRAWLEPIGTSGPSPYLVVEVAPDAPCAAVRALAAELQRLPLCGQGFCLERTAWENYRAE